MPLRLLQPILSSPLARAAFAAAVGVVFFLTMTPLPEMPAVVDNQDKLEHAVAFAGLMLLGWAGWPTRAGHVAWGLLAYGVLIELCQHTLTTNRVGDPLDWLADSLGVALGWLLVRRVAAGLPNADAHQRK